MFKVENICKTFNDFSIKNISFSLDRGEIISIIGKSGSGKSTILRLIAGLEESDHGRVFFSENYKGKINYVSQDYTLFPHLTLLENIELVSKIKNKNNYSQKANSYLKEFSLTEHKDKYPYELSGGQRQRGALIRALMIDSDILLLDEITSALDPEATKNILNMVLKLKAKNVSVIMASHELGFVKKASDRVIFLKNGTIIKNQLSGTFFYEQDDNEIKEFIDTYYL